MIRKGATILLRPHEVNYCFAIGLKRHTTNKQAGIIDQKYSKKPGLHINIQGVFGEYAIQRMLGRKMQDIRPILDNTKPRSVMTDVDHDVRIDKDRTIDVKTVDFARAPIKVRKNGMRNPPYYYVLMHYETPVIPSLKYRSLPLKDTFVTMHFNGVIRSSELFKDVHRIGSFFQTHLLQDFIL